MSSVRSTAPGSRWVVGAARPRCAPADRVMAPEGQGAQRPDDREHVEAPREGDAGRDERAGDAAARRWPRCGPRPADQPSAVARTWGGWLALTNAYTSTCALNTKQPVRKHIRYSSRRSTAVPTAARGTPRPRRTRSSPAVRMPMRSATVPATRSPTIAPDVEHEQEGERGAELVARLPHDRGQPVVEAVDQQQAHERRDADRDGVAQVPGREERRQRGGSATASVAGVARPVRPRASGRSCGPPPRPRRAGRARPGTPRTRAGSAA